MITPGRTLCSRATLRALAAVLGDWSSGPGSLYRKLTEALRRLVEEGALAPGERLPAERELAGALAVSRSTVVTAFDELRGQGVVASRQGSGTRVAAGPLPRADGRVPGGQGAAIFQRLIDGPGELISLACAAGGGAPEIAGALEDVLRHDLPALLGEPRPPTSRPARPAGRDRRAMDPSGRHNDHLRVPFTFPPETLAQLVSRLAGAWSDLERHGPCDARPLRPIG